MLLPSVNLGSGLTTAAISRRQAVSLAFASGKTDASENPWRLCPPPKASFSNTKSLKYSMALLPMRANSN